MYAELYAIIAKDAKMLLTTNIFHFLEAFDFFMEKHGVDQSVLFYTVHNGKISESLSPYDVMENLSQPSFDLARLKMEFEMDGEQ